MIKSLSRAVVLPVIAVLLLPVNHQSHHAYVEGFAFQPPAFAAAPSLMDSIQSMFGVKSGLNDSVDRQKREEIKAALLNECRSGDGDGKEKRERIESIIATLAPLSPIKDTATSSLLKKEWLLEWTTEKEINFFSDWDISGEISQTIDGNRLSNLIPFKKGGFLGVSGVLSLPDDDSTDDEAGQIRTNFVFSSATLDLGQWGSFQIPPVGAGWFDTLYLDEDLRVDINSRDDILICTPK